MSQKLILALDQGTSSSKAALFSTEMKQVALSTVEVPQIYPQNGWIEEDPISIFESELKAVKNVITKANCSVDDILCVGIANQRETIILWNKTTGLPIYNAIIWQCRRTAKYCSELEDRGYGEMVNSKTGLILDSYFSASKIKWIFDNVKGARELAEKGELLAGTVDTWLIWKLSGGKAHITDYTNASRTMLFNIHTLSWDSELLDLFNIPANILPTVKNSSEIYCNTDKDVCGFSVPLAACIGDQQSALFAQGCFEPGETKITYGSGCFMLMNTGDITYNSKNNLVSTIAIGLNEKVTYALEGSIFAGGSTLE